MAASSRASFKVGCPVTAASGNTAGAVAGADETAVMGASIAADQPVVGGKQQYGMTLKQQSARQADLSAVALGSNLGDSVALMVGAAQALQQLAVPGSFRCSTLFRTAPVGGPSGQPAFLNAVALLQWPDSPEALLQLLQQLERGAGRQRLVHWGPRSLDLDLLWSGKERRSSEQLQLPHPRLWGRRFVIEPLAQLDPDLIPPGQSISVAARLQQLIALADELPPQQLVPPHNWPC